MTSQRWRPHARWIEHFLSHSNSNGSSEMLQLLEDDESDSDCAKALACTVLHGTHLVTLPHRHVTGISSLHGRHGPTWHGSRQACSPHASGFEHICPHVGIASRHEVRATPSDSSVACPHGHVVTREMSDSHGGHSPAWHSRPHW